VLTQNNFVDNLTTILPIGSANHSQTNITFLRAALKSKKILMQA
jgi:hypothetical protein